MNIRIWYLIHKWSSLICTIFLLMLCLTGLPLIFHDEINHLSGEAEAPSMPESTPNLSMDLIVKAALKNKPGEIIKFMSWDTVEHPSVTFVTLVKSMNSPPDEFSALSIDTRTAKILDVPKVNQGFMFVMLKLHTNMFAALPGQLFLGFMGLLFTVAIISGVVLYYPFMRRLDFGSIRKNKIGRLKWLDVHNLLGVVTIAWVLVVGITGTINTLSPIIIGLWQKDQLADMLIPYQKLAPPANIGSLETALQSARKAVPGMSISFVAFPGTMFSSPHHYSVFFKGNTPLTSRLLQAALIDAQTGKLTDTREMPWYVKTLLLSQPLHFGNYGGLPMKIIWMMFDLFTIVVLGTGVYLWWGRRKTADKRINQLEQLHLDYAVDMKDLVQ